MAAEQGKKKASTDNTPETSTRVDLRIAGVIGAEISSPVYTMRQIVQGFRNTNRVSHAQMAELSDAIDRADAIARQSQQIARLAEGRLRQSHERVSLDHLVEAALNERLPQFQARGIELHRTIKPVEIIVDPGLLSSLVDAAIDWSLASQEHRMVVTLGVNHWPEHGLLVFKSQPSVIASGQERPREGVDSLLWHLLLEISRAMGVTMARETLATETILTLEFARTVRQLEGLTSMEIEASTGDSAYHTGTKALAGLRVLLISADSGVRKEVEEVCRWLGLRPDTVHNSRQAVQSIERDQPHMIIVDERVRDKIFNDLMQDIRRLDPNFGFLEIADAANTFEISSWMSDSMTRVSRDVLRAHLPSILTLELAKAF